MMAYWDEGDGSVAQAFNFDAEPALFCWDCFAREVQSRMAYQEESLEEVKERLSRGLFPGLIYHLNSAVMFRNHFDEAYAFLQDNPEAETYDLLCDGCQAEVLLRMRRGEEPYDRY